jgi:hypothetical protein
MPRKSTRLRRTLTSALLAPALLAGTLFAASPANAADPIPAPDGKSALTAAASCWEIKQLDPASESGVYWLYTPALGAPEQFYCDQATDGGGWVLIGRGREEWSTSNEGLGTPAQVRSTITGPSAFAPRQLSATVIEGLTNGSVSNTVQQDGIRLRRATNQAGSDWQEARFTLTSPRSNWSWMFNNQQRIGTWRIGTATGNGGQTRLFSADNALLRVDTQTGASTGWAQGWGYGAGVAGSTASTSYLYQSASVTGYAKPFTQAFLRPRLMSSSTLPTIADTGTAERTRPAVAESHALPTAWGVAGLGAGPNLPEGSVEAAAFAESNGIVYVGGNFTSVQTSSAGANRVTQGYVAAFRADTGAWVSTFRPVLNNAVRALAALPDGRIAVGGYFTQVNGQSVPGLTVLNGTTGATDTAFNARLINRVGAAAPAVRTLDVQGNWLYVGGVFTHATGGTSTQEAYSRSAMRFAISNGAPDRTWAPTFDGSVISLDASSQGDRVYFAGFFGTSNGTAAARAAALSATSTTVIPWSVDFSSSGGRLGYQQAVKEVGNKVWLGGSEHMLFSYNRANMAEISTNITGVGTGSPQTHGGDFQAISTDGTNIYAGCHCFFSVYSGGREWPTVGTAWTAVDKIDSAGAWNAATGKYETAFAPTLWRRAGAGAWALFNDSTGVTWFGGDFTGSLRAGDVKQWSGGFVRFAAADSKAPTVPGKLAVSATDTAVNLSWTGSTDNRGAVTYQVLRNNRVVATTTATSIELPSAPADTRYFVRAADAAGNLSASTPAAKALSADDPANPVLVAAGSNWDYWFKTEAPAAGWKGVDFDEAGWSNGVAPLGWGHSNLGTALTAEGTRPIVSYYRSGFDVADASKVEKVTLTTRADDGIVVYVNGQEVLRRNLNAGAVTHTTYANAAVSATSAVNNPITVDVPGNLFRSGANVITAEVHSNYRTTPSASFELAAQATFGTQPPVVVEPPVEEEPPAPSALVAAGSQWQYYFATAAPAAGWQGVNYAATGWSTGAAPLGWGHSNLGTTLTAEGTRPLVSYYRKSVQVADASKVQGLTLTTRADDGIVVYVNGQEVLRRNLDAGAVSHGTYANAAVSATSAVNNPITVEVPGSALVSGTNVITAEVHSNYRTTPSASFELTATVR